MFPWLLALTLGVVIAGREQEKTKKKSLYEETPLEFSSDQIRLLTILPAAYEERVVCKLRTVALYGSRPPRFSALSYAWGDDDVTLPITVNGKTLCVRPNLTAALHRIRHPTETRTIWVDAICIDQANDTEKTNQLRKMRDIYAMAHMTYIWLGQGTSESDAAIKYLKRFESSTGTEMLIQDLSINSEYWKVFSTNLMLRPWFSRLWIVQELIMSKNPRILCGSRQITWEAFAGTLSTAMVKLADATDGFKTSPLYKRLHNIDILERFRQQRLTGTAPSLVFCIGMYSDRKCKDERDHILGLLGLAADGGVPELQSLGYHQTRAEIYTAVTQYIISPNTLRLGDLDFICGVHCWKQSPELPSWVPNFCESFRGVFGLIKFNYDPGDQYNVTGEGSAGPNDPPYLRRNAEGMTHQRPSFVTPKILKVGGLIVDRISGIGSTFPPAAGGDGYDVIFDRHLKAAMPICLGPFMEDKNKQYPRKELKETYSMAFSIAINFGRNERGKRLSTLEAHELAPAFRNFQEWERDRLEGYRFVRTDDGYIGLVPARAQCQDFVCILWGCSVPVVLRNIDGSHWSLVGPCYIHGIMDGEMAERMGARTFDIV